MNDLRERLIKLANDNPALRKEIVPILKKAGWEITVVKPDVVVTDRMIEALVIQKAGYLGVVKGSLVWEPKPTMGKFDYSIDWGWNMKGIDPVSNEEYNIRGMLKIRMNMFRKHSYEAWIGVHT